MILTVDSIDYRVRISYNADTRTYWARTLVSLGAPASLGASQGAISFGYSTDDVIRRLANRISRIHELWRKAQ